MSRTELLFLLSWLIMLISNIGLHWIIKDLQEIIEGQDSVIEKQRGLLGTCKEIIQKHIEVEEKE